MNYDIIGDIHGHADALIALLHDLGYRNRQGAWRHPSREVIFVGDFIDRGPNQIETVNIVRRMQDAGTCQAIMGNHEFNAIAWFLPDPDLSGEFLRMHYSPKYGDKNRKQHQKFLNEVEGTHMHREIVEWFQQLPLFLDLTGLRVIHACWHPAYLAYLSPFLTQDNCLPSDLMVNAAREPDDDSEKDSSVPTVFMAIETLLKGIEIPLPPPHTFLDKDGLERSRVRVRWWDHAALNYRDTAMLSEEERADLPSDPIPEHVRIGHDGGKPVFIGHYWLTGTPVLLSDKVACVDYSIARGGKLVAYRWDGEPLLDQKKLCWVG